MSGPIERGEFRLFLAVPLVSQGWFLTLDDSGRTEPGHQVGLRPLVVSRVVAPRCTFFTFGGMTIPAHSRLCTIFRFLMSQLTPGVDNADLISSRRRQWRLHARFVLFYKKSDQKAKETSQEY